MKKRLLALLSVVVLAVSVSATAGAQPRNAQFNQGNLISALNNINVQIDRLNALNDLTIGEVHVVHVSDVLNNNRVLNNALNRNNVEILNLRNVLTNFDCLVCHILNESLNNNNVLIQDVVAVNVLSGGDVIIFHNTP